MTVARSEIIRRAALRLGGHSGTATSTSGVGTAAALSGLIDTTGDDSRYVGWHLFFPDAASEADRERVITDWNDSQGVATFKARSDTTWTSETYILSPDYTLDEYRQALNKALRESKRSYRYVMPVIPGIDRYRLADLTWLEGADDIDAVWGSDSPNMLHNEDFELWQNGSDSAPDGWTLAGTGASVARASTGVHSPYSAVVTRASSDATLYQGIPPALVQYLVRSTSAPLPVISFGARVTASTASIARVGIYNGSSTTWSSYHTGNGVPQFLESTYQTTSSDTALRFVCSVDTSAGSASFQLACMVQANDLPSELADRGSIAYSEHDMNSRVRNMGGVPVLDIPRHASGQIIIYSRREFPAMSADTDVVEDQYATMLEHGLVRYLSDSMKPNQNRERLDRIRGESAALWSRALTKNITKPVPEPIYRVRVGGI